MKKTLFFLFGLTLIGIFILSENKDRISFPISDTSADKIPFSNKLSNDKQVNLTNDEVATILSDYGIQLEHEFAFITEEMENRIYGKWEVTNSIGYSLKYDITGGQLDEGQLVITKEEYKEILNAYREPYIRTYSLPLFIYYNETLEEMSEDVLLNYSGIDGVDLETQGTVLLGFGLSDYSSGCYDIILTKFIMIEDYVIAVRSHSFYQLNKMDE